MTSLLDSLEKRGLVVRSPIPRTVASLIDITPQAATILDQLPAFHQREKMMISAAPAEPEQLRLLELLAKFQQSACEHAHDEPDRPGPRVLPNRLRRRGLGRLDDNNTEGASPSSRTPCLRSSA